MKALLLFALVVVLVGGGLRMAGVRLPFLDYPIGPVGVDTPGPFISDQEIEAPGFNNLHAP